MKNNVELNWPRIRKVFNNSFSSSFHYSFATIDEDNGPRLTPFGSLVLNKSIPKGVYFEIFSNKTKKNMDNNQRVCVMAVNSSRWFWIKSLLNNKFKEPPAIRLFGEVGPIRKATKNEIARWERRIAFLRFTPGYKTLWGNLVYVREITFHKYETVNLGDMTKNLWS